MEQTQQNHFTALFYKNVLLGILSMAAQSILFWRTHFSLQMGSAPRRWRGLTLSYHSLILLMD